MNFLNQPKNIRGHDEQISNSARARIPICVWHSSWHEHARARGDLDLIGADLNAQDTLEYVPSLIVAVVEMRGAMIRGGTAGPPASCHSATTKALLIEPRTFPESGGATIGELIPRHLLAAYIFY